MNQTFGNDETVKKNAHTIEISHIEEPFLKYKYKTINCKQTKKASRKGHESNFYSESKGTAHN